MKLRVFVLAGVVSVSLFAFSAENVANTAIKTAGEVAKAAINKNKTEVTVKNSKLNNNVTIKEGASIGNSGISIKGEKVKVENSKINNHVTIKRGVSFGNSGVELGK